MARWIKFYTDMFTQSRRLKAIEKMKNGDTFLLIWIKLLLLAGDVNDGGEVYITSTKPYTIEQLSDELCKKPKIVSEALDLFKELGLIERDESGFLLIPSWETYQTVEGTDRVKEQTRERVKKFRERKKGVACNVTCNVTERYKVTECNAPEEEREKEEDIHSFTLFLSGTRTDADAHAGGGNAEKHDLKSLQLEFSKGELGQGIILMSDAQWEELFRLLSYDELHKYCGIIRDCERNGKIYKKKSHYHAILDMVKKDRRIGR